MTVRQKALVGFGVITVLAGVLIPREWFVPLPSRTPLPPPPLSGHALVQVALFAENVAVFERVWYGRHDTSENMVTEFAGRVERLRTSAMTEAG